MTVRVRGSWHEVFMGAIFDVLHAGEEESTGEGHSTSSRNSQVDQIRF